MKRIVLIILLLAVCLAMILPARPDPAPFLGAWKGLLGQAKTEVTFHFGQDADGKIAGTVDLPEGGVYGDALTEIKIEGKAISFSVPSAGSASFKGTLDETGKVLDMTLSRDGRDMEFTLTRLADGAASPGQTSPRLTLAEARKIIADGNREWGRARVAHDRPTFERMLAPDFYAQLQGRKLTRQEFIDGISAAPRGARLTRFDATVLTVQPTADGWVALIHEKLESEPADGKGEKSYGLWITRDGWKMVNGQWVIAYSEAVGSEQWRGGAKPPFLDW